MSMPSMRSTRLALALAAGTLFPTVALAQTTADAPNTQYIATFQDQINRFNDHLVTLASPWMEGRVPGSAGMERAKDYTQYYFEAFGLDPAFPAEIDGEMTDFASYRDPFGLGGSWDVNDEKMLAMSEGGAVEMAAEDEFVFTALGGNGEVTAPAVFVGYSIDNGEDGWSSYGEDDDLSGKIAVMFRFEPMGEDGTSMWADSGWTPNASFDNKIRGAVSRGAEAVVIINPAAANDQRLNSTNRYSTSGGSGAPVFIVTADSGEKLLQGLDPRDRSLNDFMALANVGGGAVELDGMLSLKGDADANPLIAENVGAILPGVGELADEYIVIGGHLDHVGMGYFGSRSGPGKLHPGADDNASGAAGLLLIAEKLVNTFSSMDPDEPRRSIIFIAFTGEESGLNGSRHYVQDPIVDIAQHTIMINWDMIGRIVEDRVTVAGANTGEGLEEFLQPYLDNEDYGLTPIVPETMSGASDHTPFYMGGVPVLFSICDFADFHEDYHTPTDTVDKINREGAVKTVAMYHDIVRDMVTLDEMFAHVSPQQQNRRTEAAANADRPRINVRVGITPGSYDSSDRGIPIASVTEGSSAANAGLREGDRLVRWDGQKLRSVEDWMPLLARHQGGDTVNIGVYRDGEEITLEITLEGR